MHSAIRITTSRIKHKNIAIMTPSAITYYGIRAMLTTLNGVSVTHHPIQTHDEQISIIDKDLDLIIIDTEVGNADVISVLIKSYSPTASVMILTRASDIRLLQKYKKSGVQAILNRKSSQREVEDAVTAVLEHRIWGFEVKIATPQKDTSPRQLFSSRMYEEAMLSLTTTERTIIRSIYRGRTVTDIAVAKDKSIKTISSQKQAAMRKLNVRNLAELHQRYHAWLE
ncbi:MULTISPECIES: LuxR C-terminal-related transcriptional regulator [unclassified Pantoea]|uniref:LuxR C-terminal-related transcriptional regulator n=1 Tax=unclassified Pantoea TaxID=2630326 RepID=UPI001CD4253E|nr:MULTISPECIES: LuxR C-terminal-related transcriptional regulator [unclassified Pantoea]MCA1174921.1 LuxR C-terminal-related transcriptional regulator [Pantoea sp. alder69]MCA1249883.1 LuxR C-terminal-related transcriptional regulator [Pantoea sp. alder70]MCA1264162.1 LuxR C-terminal-related transcriptional regulator [Pantoea sp. alder81]